MAVGHHQTQHLADVLDLLGGKHRLVMHKGGQQFVARNIVPRHHGTHTWRGQDRAQVQGQDAATGHVAQDGRCMQRAFGQRQIVDVSRLALYVQVCAFVAGLCI